VGLGLKPGCSVSWTAVEAYPNTDFPTKHDTSWLSGILTEVPGPPEYPPITLIYDFYVAPNTASTARRIDITFTTSGTTLGPPQYGNPGTGLTQFTYYFMQDAKPHCTFDAYLNRIRLFDAPGASTSITVTATPSDPLLPASLCTWNTRVPDWVTITSQSATYGNGTINITVLPNTGDMPRVGTIYVGDQAILIGQAPVWTDSCPVDQRLKVKCKAATDGVRG
jgi:hypothetical protein